MSGSPRTAPPPPITRRSRWPGWIWAVPIAALGISAWLLVRAYTEGGTDIVITFDDAHGLDPKGTDVTYRGMVIGKVDGEALSDDGQTVEVHANIKDDAAKLLTTGAVFWLRGANPTLSNLASLGAVLSGPSIVLLPGGGAPAKRFRGLAHEPLPADRGPATQFLVDFDGPAGQLSPGDRVELRGFAVGEVQTVGFRYDAQAGRVDTPVTIALYPALMHVQAAQADDAPAALRAMVGDLVAHGLRAKLERDPALIGSYGVTLEHVAGAPAATLATADGLPAIPAAPASGLDSMVAKVGELPLDQIGQNVLDIARRVDTIVASPKLDDAVAQLDASLKGIHGVVDRVGPQLDPLVASLRKTASQLDQVAGEAGNAIGGPAHQTGLDDTLRELKDAARSVRSLADYLDRHPEALLAGRRKS